MNEETMIPSGPSQTLEWITVLCAADLEYRLSQEEGEWVLHIPETQAAAARAEIHAYENERLPATPSPAPKIRINASAPAWTSFWFAYALILFYLWMGPFQGDLPIFQAGSAHAEKILAGEWWRTITALTLHSGEPHVLANAFFLFFIAQAVIHALGRGVGLALILAGGILGNAIAAYFSDPWQISIGASTMCFAALGIMSLLQTMEAYHRYRQWQAVWNRAWIPMASGIALLGLMGTGPQSDLGGHAFGFLAGALIAIPFSIFGSAWVNKTWQWIVTALTIMIPVIAWLLAIQSTPSSWLR